MLRIISKSDAYSWVAGVVLGNLGEGTFVIPAEAVFGWKLPRDQTQSTNSLCLCRHVDSKLPKYNKKQSDNAGDIHPSTLL